MPEDEGSPGEAFWQFSLVFYALPGVAEALLTLQDRDRLDVNLILFALWLAISGRGRLDSDTLAAAERAIGGLRTGIVEPLRTLRRKLKDHPDADIQRLRERVKALELDGEKLVQKRLARLAGPVLGDIRAEDRRAAALANLSLYLGPEIAGAGEAVIIRDALAAFRQASLPFPPAQSPDQSRGAAG